MWRITVARKKGKKKKSKVQSVSALEKKIVQYMEKNNVGVEEATRILTQLRRPEKVRRTYDHFSDSQRVRFGIISDTHIGHKCFNHQAFEDSIKMFNKYKVEAIYHCGDVLEGMSGREGHVYELERLGMSSQMDLAIDLLSQYKQPLYFTTGNHDEWGKKKMNLGFEVGPELERRLSNGTFLGEYTADIRLHRNVTMRLTHEGSTAYALSYSTQKRVNALSGGDKPEILFNGHLHKAIYMLYRNIHCFEAATLEDQTPFMKMKGSPAHVGFWIVDVQFNKKGINEITPRLFPHY